MLLELIIAGILVHKAIDSEHNNLTNKILNSQNRLYDLLLCENQKLKEELEQLKNNKESL